jgi:hypothetical protein
LLLFFFSSHSKRSMELHTHRQEIMDAAKQITESAHLLFKLDPDDYTARSWRDSGKRIADEVRILYFTPPDPNAAAYDARVPRSSQIAITSYDAPPSKSFWATDTRSGGRSIRRRLGS